MNESYQREEYCSDQRKGSLRHFQPPKNWGSNFKDPLSLRASVARIGEIAAVHPWQHCTPKKN